MPNFNGDNGKAAAERKRVLERLPENMKAEEKAEVRKAIEAAQRRGAPPAIFEPRCHVCTHQHRHWIETMLIYGQSYVSISRAIEQSPADDVDRRSISKHAKEHMNVQDAAMRAVIETEAELEGKNFEEGVANVLTMRSILEVMAHKGYKDIVDGNVTVEPRDLIQIARIKSEMDNQGAISAAEEARLQVQIMTEAIRRAFPQAEDQAKVVREIKLLKKQYGLEQAEKLLDNPDVIEAEVVNT